MPDMNCEPPLTSLRTNLELLIAASRPGAPAVPEQDMVDLRADVMAQIEELSTLVGDLVDLAREDAPEVVYEEVDLAEIIEQALERVRRRRNDIEFELDLSPWYIFGEQHGLSRAVLNVLDNAAKWSPPGDIGGRRADADRDVHRAAHRRRRRSRDSRGGPWSRLRTLLSFDAIEVDAGIRSGPGDRAAGRRTSWWHRRGRHVAARRCTHPDDFARPGNSRGTISASDSSIRVKRRASAGHDGRRPHHRQLCGYPV